MTAYVGEIRLFAGNFPPNGWMFCEGQALPIAENDVLFQLIGTTYGGDGQETFNLPNLASRVPIHMGTGPDGTTYQIGEMAGTESETLAVQQIPSHNHPPGAYLGSGDRSSAENAVFAASPLLYGNPADASPSELMRAGVMQPAGGSQPHENMAPFLGINYIISLFGVFPSQT